MVTTRSLYQYTSCTYEDVYREISDTVQNWLNAYFIQNALAADFMPSQAVDTVQKHSCVT